MVFPIVMVAVTMSTATTFTTPMIVVMSVAVPTTTATTVSVLVFSTPMAAATTTSTLFLRGVAVAGFARLVVLAKLLLVEAFF